MDKHEKLNEEQAVVAHSMMALLHGLGVVYHVRRPDTKFVWVAFHAGAGFISALSVLHHLNKVGEK